MREEALERSRRTLEMEREIRLREENLRHSAYLREEALERSRRTMEM